MDFSTLTPEGRIEIPAELLERLELQAGDGLLLNIEDGRLVIAKDPRSWLERLQEFAGDHWKGAAEEIQRERDAWYRAHGEGDCGSGC